MVQAKDEELALTKTQQSAEAAKINEQLIIAQNTCKSQLDALVLQGQKEINERNANC